VAEVAISAAASSAAAKRSRRLEKDAIDMEDEVVDAGRLYNSNRRIKINGKYIIIF